MRFNTLNTALSFLQITLCVLDGTSVEIHDVKEGNNSNVVNNEEELVVSFNRGTNEKNGFRELQGPQWSAMGNPIKLDVDGGYASGYAVAMSGDGLRTAISAYTKVDSDYVTVVQVYEWSGSAWDKLGDPIFGERKYWIYGPPGQISTSLSHNGDRIVIGAPWNSENGGSGTAQVYQYHADGWKQMGGDFQANDRNQVTMSADGNHVGIVKKGRVEVHEWDTGKTGGRFQRMGARIDDQVDGLSVFSLSMAGDRVAIGYKVKSTATGLVRVFEWNKSKASWKQLGSDLNGSDRAGNDYLFGKSVSLVQDMIMIHVPGKIHNKDSYVRVYRWSQGYWQQQGSDIEDEGSWTQCLGSVVAASNAGDRFAIGAPCYGSRNQGRVRSFQWDSSKSEWEQLGNDIEGVSNNNHFGGGGGGFGVSMSASGDEIGVRYDGEYSSRSGIHIFKLDGERSSLWPFPEDFDEVVCEYMSCLDHVIDGFGSFPATFGSDAIDEYVAKSKRKAVGSKQAVGNKGKLVKSLIRLSKSMGKIQLFQEREVTKDFFKPIGAMASGCAIGLVENFYNSILNGNGVFVEIFSDTDYKGHLNFARKKQRGEYWNKSIKESVYAVESMLGALAEMADPVVIPTCND